jgi:Sulfotransferase domain/N-terminal domain of galactosyltransferase
MKIVFATTCRNRRQHLQKTLPQNLKDNQTAKFVVLDYGSDDGLGSWLMSAFEAEMASGRLAVYSYPQAGRFRMAHAKNMAHRCAIIEGAEIIVNLDADNFAGLNFDLFLRDVFAVTTTDTAMHGSAGAYMWARMIQGQMRRGISGRIAMTTRDFWLTGGYDEAYEDWGPDDKDMNIRLERLGRVPLEIPQKYLDAIHHKDKLRFREYPHAKPHAGCSGLQFYPGHDRVVANGGVIGCGTVYKNYGWIETTFNPVPARIFCIGNQKTGTQSLDKALKLLGFDAAHWLSGYWAKKIVLEMRQGRSQTLEQHYALSDLPITFLYRELDKAYPGSKFILTTVPDEQWLEAAAKHWSYEHNVFRKDWDAWPAVNFIHKLMYGRADFEPGVFLERYRRHNAEVREYFRDRPNQFLDLPLDQGDPWRKLCVFLNRQGTPGRFPHIDRTRPKGTT